MVASFAFLRDIRPYKTSWRVQVKVLHSWRQYTSMTGETLELVLADSQGVKIHASVKKDLVSKYVNNLSVNEWRFIETFALNHASGQFHPTGHLYKMSFVTVTQVTRCDPIGKVRVVCTIYGLDTDWSWYYFSCRNCNKKVTHIHSGVNTYSLKPTKPRFWCDVCKNAVTNVQAKYMLYVKVMDNTGETKCLLFDSICADMVGESAASLLGGSFNEIEDPNDVPDVIRNLVGKTFLFLISVEKENETSDSVTPSSKRVYATKLSASEQSSSSKKICIQSLDLEKSDPEFSDECMNVKNAEFPDSVDGNGTMDKGKGVKCHETPPVNDKKVASKVVT
ncbi:Nucleic acid-binding OB-fold [Arabidopsis suecica]|uniref:Nucleic acid-binding OB-fold n=1 Tax=Arabidopsis suecica TaxID=45249 RepID=A0A8T1XZP0_ARASU|nr:Nucleic acid-binding OB-fold [Arabidopsis suecica]